MKFGNLVTYTGKYLSTAKKKAENGNLVFAKISGSTEIEEGSEKYAADYDKDGYYIYAGGAEALLVDLDTFKSLKSEVKDLQTKVGELKIGDKTYNTVAEYVVAYVASKITTSVREAAKATNDVVPTEKAVRDAIDAVAAVANNALTGVSVNGTAVTVENNVAKLTADTTVTKDSTNLVTSGAVEAAISSLGTVMEFKGVVEGDDLPAVGGYNAGDVIIFKGEEYVLGADSEWHEIGQVKEDESVISLAGKSGAITIGTGLVMGDDKKLDVKLAEKQGNVTLDITNGLSASVAADDIAYENTSHIDTETEVKSVKAALDEIFEDELVIANSLVDLNSRMEGAESDIEELKTGLGAVEHTTVSDGNTGDFVTIAETAQGNHKNYAISATVVKGTTGDTGLATDAYVRETVANSVDTALTWKVLSDEDGE